MSVLSNEGLQERLASTDPDNRLIVTPMLDFKKQVGPGSIDLRLGTDFLLPRRVDVPGIDPGQGDAQMEVDESQERRVVPLGDAVWLHPQQFVLGSTLEFIRIPPDCSAYVLGRSSWGRIGLLVATAVTVQPGFAGSLTLELVNEGDLPIKLWPGLRVAQLVVHQLDQLTDVPYDARFVRAVGPEPAKLGWEDAEVKKLRAVGSRLGGDRARAEAQARPALTASAATVPSQ